MTDEFEFACGIPTDGDYWGEGEALVEMVKQRFPSVEIVQAGGRGGWGPVFWRIWAPSDQCEAVRQWVDDHWLDAVEMVLRREADQS